MCENNLYLVKLQRVRSFAFRIPIFFCVFLTSLSLVAKLEFIPTKNKYQLLEITPQIKSLYFRKSEKKTEIRREINVKNS